MADHIELPMHREGPTPMVTAGTGAVDPGADQPAYVAELAAELRARLRGEVRFDDGSRATYSTDSSNYRQVPIGVVVPRTVEDVVQTVALCRRHGAPIVSRGGGTSLAGQACNVAVVLDFSKYLNRVLEIDPERKLAKVEAGCNLDTLRSVASRMYGLTYGPDPATHNRNTLGGMIGNNSCGIHSVMAEFFGPGPLTRHQVHSLDILTYDGERMTVGETSAEELRAILAEGGRRARIYAELKDLRDRHIGAIRSRYPDIPRRVSGYNLDALLDENGFNVAAALVGTEGTCVTVLSATVKLMDEPKARSLLVLGYPDVYHAGDHVPTIMAHKPIGLEGLDDELVGYMKKKGLHPSDVDLLPEGKGWLLVEFGGDSKDDSDARAREVMDSLRGQDDAPSMKLFDDAWQEEKLWAVRESGLGATARVPGMGQTHPGWEDAAVAPEQVGAYLREFRELLQEFDYHAALYGHFGQGCIHCRIDFDLKTASGVATYLRFIDKAADLVVKHRGSLSGEHGDGQARAALLPKMYGDELVSAFREFKHVWDPDGRMNPGKVVDPHAPDDDLRSGPDFAPATPATHFQYPQDGGSFTTAVERCVGVGKCRRAEGGTMCPSYMVTFEEEDSTRGRSRLLYEMVRGDFLHDGWKDDHVKEALDLCLACKGCKTECPVNVDMATYKAEVFSHYYEGRLRPRSAYAMGWIYWWSRLAAPFAGIVNWFSQTEPFAGIAKRAGGIAPERDIPTFASPTLRDWFIAREGHSAGETPRFRPEAEAAANLHHGDVPRFRTHTYEEHEGRQGLNELGAAEPFRSKHVLLWPDTFNNYLMTDAGKATVEVLERIGYEVDIPPRPLCCGRPLYDFGMLDTAERLWRQILDTLRPHIQAGVPLVGVEPSCIAAFRDELVNLFPHDEDAQRLSQQTFTLSEFLEHENYEPPRLERKAVVHGHCHHKAIMHMDAEVSMLQRLGLDFELLDSGCCGMAGSFGFEEEKYEVSIRAGERVLLPAVRNAPKDALIIANGFSCREQILQATDRQALHLAQVILMAMRHAEHPGVLRGPYPERGYNESLDHPPMNPVGAAAIGLGAVLLGGALAVRALRRRGDAA